MLESVRRVLGDPIANWRTGSRESQVLTMTVLLVGVAVSFVVSLRSYRLMPLTAYFVWLLLGMLLLRFVPLLLVGGATAAAGIVALLSSGALTSVRVAAIVTMLLSLTLILFQSSRQRSGLPGPVSVGMLADLRDRLQAQAKVPQLPAGWHSQTAMVAAYNVGYGGDFLVSELSADRRHLEMILVDVCGNGVGAATEALQFSGALGGLIGALPPAALFACANDFLLRQHSDETFATAVHVLVDLETGRYQLTSAGHPPVLIWSNQEHSWATDGARGTALGIIRRPDLEASSGSLRAGDALLFYTDGVVESRTASLDEGIDWLRAEATSAIRDGFPGAAKRILRRVARGDDDRAVLLLWRDRDRDPA